MSQKFIQPKEREDIFKTNRCVKNNNKDKWTESLCRAHCQNQEQLKWIPVASRMFLLRSHCCQRLWKRVSGLESLTLASGIQPKCVFRTKPVAGHISISALHPLLHSYLHPSCQENQYPQQILPILNTNIKTDFAFAIFLLFDLQLMPKNIYLIIFL